MFKLAWLLDLPMGLGDFYSFVFFFFHLFFQINIMNIAPLLAIHENDHISSTTQEHITTMLANNLQTM